MYYPFSWIKSVARLVLFLIFFAIIGWYVEDMLLAVAMGALVVAGWAACCWLLAAAGPARGPFRR